MARRKFSLTRALFPLAVLFGAIFAARQQWFYFGLLALTTAGYWFLLVRETKCPGTNRNGTACRNPVNGAWRACPKHRKDRLSYLVNLVRRPKPPRPAQPGTTVAAARSEAPVQSTRFEISGGTNSVVVNNHPSSGRDWVDLIVILATVGGTLGTIVGLFK